jgi:biopolymer transport protein ExbD
MNFTDMKQIIVDRPAIQMTPLIDMVFLTLIFFMSAFVFYELENELDISVPPAEESHEIQRSPGEIIINIRKDGTIVVNQRKLGFDELKTLLARVAAMYKGQPVIIRGDNDTKHKYVIKVLDICAASNIWNISFATMKEEGK